MSTQHTCDALVATCIDFRFQDTIDDWVHENIGHGNFDRVEMAGGIYDLDAVLKQVAISVRLHDIKRVVFMNHEDCGAYGPEGSDERHRTDLLAAKQAVNTQFSHLEVQLYYLRLDGRVQEITD